MSKKTQTILFSILFIAVNCMGFFVEKIIPIHWFYMPAAGTTLGWFLFDLGNVLSIIIIFLWFYINIPFSEVFLKTILLMFCIFSIKEIPDLIFFNNQKSQLSFMIDIGISMLIILIFIYKSNRWALKNIPQYNFYKNGIYLIIDYPNNFISFISTWVGCDVGSIKLISKTHESVKIFRYKHKNKYLVISEFNIDNEKLILLPIKDYKAFTTEAIKLEGEKYHFIKRNCISVYFPLFKKYGISTNIFSFIPSVFIKKFI